MKTHKFSYLLCLTLGITALASSRLGFAAEPPKSTGKSMGTETSEYDLEISDGQVIHNSRKMPASLANVVEVLRDRYRQANIVLSPGLGTVTISDLKLRASRLPEELEALRIASGDKFIVRAPGGPQKLDPTTGLAAAPDADSSSGLYILEAVRLPQEEHVVEAFNLGPYLQWVRDHSKEDGRKEQQPQESLETIPRMILDTLDRFNQRNENKSPATDFKYYKDANLFVVIGSRDAVDIARKIINVLPGMAAIDNSVASQYGLAPAIPPKNVDPAMDPFRRRYGLSPAVSLPANNPPAEPGTKR